MLRAQSARIAPVRDARAVIMRAAHCDTNMFIIFLMFSTCRDIGGNTAVNNILCPYFSHTLGQKRSQSISFQFLFSLLLHRSFFLVHYSCVYNPNCANGPKRHCDMHNAHLDMRGAQNIFNAHFDAQRARGTFSPRTGALLSRSPVSKVGRAMRL